MTPPPDPSSYLEQGSGAFLRRLEAMRNGVYGTLVSPEKTDAWDADQLGLQRQINDLARELGIDVDPAVVTGSDDFAHLTLEQIRDLVYEIKPDVVHAVSEAWGKIGSSLGDATRTLDDALKKAIAGGWEGAGAKAAADSLATFTKTSDDISKSAAMVGMKVAFAQRGSDETFRMLYPVLQAAAPTPTIQIPGMPAIPNVVPGTTVGPVPIPAAQQGKDSQYEEAREAAVQVLQNVYAPGIRGGDDGVPVLPAVQPTGNPGGPVGPVGPSPTPGPETPNLGGGEQQPAPGEAKPDAGTEAGANNDGSQPPGTQPAANTPGNGQAPSSTPGPGGSDPAATTAAGFDPTAPGGGTSGTGLGSGTSGPGLGGLHGSGSGGGLPGPGSGKPGLGSAMPGGIAAAAQQGVPPGLRSPGQAGAPGMSGVPGGGKGGKSEEDKDRQSAEYLRGHHLEEWIEDGRKVLPAYGAIGEYQEQERESASRPPAPRPPSPPERGRSPGEYR